MIKKNTFDRLNLLRICAFFMIFLLHAKIFIPCIWYENVDWAWILYTPAWAGVWIFFVLSGYGIGAGFYLSKYKLTGKGVLKYYYKRLLKILPLYWLYLGINLLFITPEYLLPGRDSTSKIVKLLIFNYREEFDSIYFGLAWYLSTLIKLYFIAPIIFFVLRYFLEKMNYFWIVYILLLIVGMGGRIAMGYHISLTGIGDWSYNIYKPWYFNLDLFFCGFILNELRFNTKITNKKSIPFLPWIFLLCLVLINCKIYFNASYLGGDAMNIYCYIFPTIYLLLISFFIVNYDICRKNDISSLSKKSIKENKARIIDAFSKILMPLYLFHSTILLCVQKGYQESWYLKLTNTLQIPPQYTNFAIGCFFTFIALILTILVAIFIHCIFEKTMRIYLDIFFTSIMNKSIYIFKTIKETSIIHKK